MKMRESLQDQTIKIDIKKYFGPLSANMLGLYKKHGESTECIHAIQDEIKKFYYSRLREQSTFYNIIKPYSSHEKKMCGKAVYRIVDDENFMVALHLTPKGVKFPVHSHPYMLNSLLVVRGALKVEQYNFIDMMPESKHSILQAGSCSVGLQKKYNTHALETIAPFNVFFSIRCKVPKTETHKSRQFKLPKLFALGLSLFASLSCYSNQQTNAITLLTATAPFTHSDHRAVESVAALLKRANKLREKGEESQYDAAQLYLIAANKNNPEAQYWLGYMHLMGMGITEDNEEALNWIASSANQGYPPAEEMLNHLLNTESEYDC